MHFQKNLKIRRSSIKHFIRSCAYSIPDSSDEFAPNFYLDDIYDGKPNDATNRLEGGLGVLTDGYYGNRVILSDQGIAPGNY